MGGGGPLTDVGGGRDGERLHHQGSSAEVLIQGEQQEVPLYNNGQPLHMLPCK